MTLRFLAGFLFSLILFAASSGAWAETLKLDAQSVGRGQPLVLRTCLGKRASTGTASLAGAEAVLIKAKNGCLAGILAPDLKVKPESTP